MSDDEPAGTVHAWLGRWPVYRQLTGADRLGRGAAAISAHSAGLHARTRAADRTVASGCPYCAVGCAQQVSVRDGRGVQIEGNEDSPVVVPQRRRLQTRAAGWVKGRWGTSARPGSRGRRSHHPVIAQEPAGS